MSDQGPDQQTPGYPQPPSGPVPPQQPPYPPEQPVAPAYPPQPPAEQPAYAPPPPPEPPAYAPPVPPPAYAPPAAAEPPAYTPPPAGPPAYAPPAYMPPQQQPGQPPYGQPYGQPPAQPPKKKGRGGIIAIVIALIVLCGLIGCAVLGVALFKGGSSGGNSVAQAEAHFQAAMSAVEAANASLKALQMGDSSVSQVSKVIADVDASLRTARDEIAAARTIADGWKDSQGKTDYLASLAATTLTLDALQDLVAYLDTASGMVAKSKQGGKEASAGFDDLNAAIRAGNRRKYSDMRAKAQLAASHYVKAALLFREAHSLDKTAGLDKAAKYADVRKQQADVAVRLAAAGLAHHISAYNRDIKKLNALGRDSEKIGTPAIVSDPSGWADKRFSALDKRITDASTQADDLRKKALQELGYTK